MRYKYGGTRCKKLSSQSKMKSTDLNHRPYEEKRDKMHEKSSLYSIQSSNWT